MKGRIRISKELCKGCGYCAEACPLGVITIDNRFNKSGYYPALAAYPEKCTGCAICGRVCPEIAITVFRERIRRRR